MIGHGLGEVRGAGTSAYNLAQSNSAASQMRDRSPIEMAIEEIDKAVDSINYELTELGMRLQPISRPAVPATADRSLGEAPMPVRSQIEDRLSALARRLRSLAAETEAKRSALDI